MRIEGWREDDRELLEKLLWLHAVKYEHLYGTSACMENLEYSLHLPDDICRHSSPDNYWCFMYERMVRFYKSQTTNQKNLAKTLADRAAQLEFVTTYLETHSIPLSGQPTSNFQTCLADPVVLVEKTVEEGLALKEHVVRNLDDLPGSVTEQYSLGILIGSPKLVVHTTAQINDIKFWLEQKIGYVPSELPQTAQSFPRLLKSNEHHLAAIFRTGETIVLRDYHTDSQEWVLEISQFLLYGMIEQHFYVFIMGDFFAAKAVGGSIDLDEWTGLPKMVRKVYHRLCLQSASLISWKVMLYPDPTNNNHRDFIL